MATKTNLQASFSRPSQDSLDLGSLPPIFVSATHLEIDDMHELEERLAEAGATLTYDIGEAKIVLSKAERKRRAQFDLQSKGLWTEEVTAELETTLDSKESGVPSLKRIKVEDQIWKDEAKVIAIDGSDTESESADIAEAEPELTEESADGVVEIGGPVQAPLSQAVSFSEQFRGNSVKVLKIAWFEDSFKQGKPLPIEPYLVFEGRPVSRPTGDHERPLSTVGNSRAVLGKRPTTMRPSGYTIVERAKADAPVNTLPFKAHGGRRFGRTAAAPTGASFDRGGHTNQYAHLLHETTSEHDLGISSDLPEMPDWVQQHTKYACQRVTLAKNPNDEFLALLKTIKLARLLTDDEIGVRAYSTSIAAIAAYPYRISNPREILALPGCDVKIANLLVEYVNTGGLKAAEDAENDEELKVLRLFYEIWGVGATTAREFYYDRGWRELDDIVEFGWSILSRVQQIGVKYYDEFLSPIPRAEVEQIASVIHRHAVKVRDECVQSLVVGGYRRGKEACGDVDIIVSHPDVKETLNIVNDIVASLEEEGWITHTLLLSLTSTQRGQQTLPFRTGGGGGHGFDTLDKALVVWQDPEWPSKQADLAKNPKAKNPNIHRRVDIIISPWRTVGCAVTGWSGGTTFQRDLRRYVKAVKGWKFDSSGIRDRADGQIVDVEGYDGETGAGGRAKTMVEAEKRVFAGLGLVWREAWERCTG